MVRLGKDPLPWLFSMQFARVRRYGFSTSSDTCREHGEAFLLG